jgi:hypothetical protein
MSRKEGERKKERKEGRKERGTSCCCCCCTHVLYNYSIRMEEEERGQK